MKGILAGLIVLVATLILISGCTGVAPLHCDPTTDTWKCHDSQDREPVGHSKEKVEPPKSEPPTPDPEPEPEPECPKTHHVG